MDTTLYVYQNNGDYRNPGTKIISENQAKEPIWEKEQLLHLYLVKKGTPSAGMVVAPMWHLVLCKKTDRELLTVPRASVWLSLHCWHSLSDYHLSSCPLVPLHLLSTHLPVCLPTVLSSTSTDFGHLVSASELWLDNGLTYSPRLQQASSWEFFMHFYQLPLNSAVASLTFCGHSATYTCT